MSDRQRRTWLVVDSGGKPVLLTPSKERALFVSRKLDASAIPVPHDAWSAPCLYQRVVFSIPSSGTPMVDRREYALKFTGEAITMVSIDQEQNLICLAWMMADRQSDELVEDYAQQFCAAGVRYFNKFKGEAMDDQQLKHIAVGFDAYVNDLGSTEQE